MPRLELFRFRYRETLSGKWKLARYRAERHEIAARFAEWEIIGPAEVRNVDPEARYVTPHRPAISNLETDAELRCAGGRAHRRGVEAIAFQRRAIEKPAEAGLRLLLDRTPA